MASTRCLCIGKNPPPIRLASDRIRVSSVLGLHVFPCLVHRLGSVMVLILPFIKPNAVHDSQSADFAVVKIDGLRRDDVSGHSN